MNKPTESFACCQSWGCPGVPLEPLRLDRVLPANSDAEEPAEEPAAGVESKESREKRRKTGERRQNILNDYMLIYELANGVSGQCSCTISSRGPVGISFGGKQAVVIRFRH